MQPPIKNIIVFASGAGSNAQQIISHSKKNKAYNVALIVCNKLTAGVIKIAEENNIPYLIITKDRFLNGDAYLPVITAYHPSLIVLAGFLWKVPEKIINAFRGKIINIHPALLPAFGGKGMYGDFVHRAVLDASETKSGITIHYVDEHYDKGDIIFQKEVSVSKTDTIESLSKKIRALEHACFPLIIEKIIIEQHSN